MNEKKIQKHIYFIQTQIDILDDMIKNIPGINSYSESARYAVLCLSDEEVSDKETNLVDIQQKLNTMAKTIDILLIEIVERIMIQNDEVVNLLASNLESQERVLQKIIDNNTRLFDLLDNGVESYE